MPPHDPARRPNGADRGLRHSGGYLGDLRHPRGRDRERRLASLGPAGGGAALTVQPTVSLEQYKAEGFLELPGFFEREEVEQVRRDAKDVFLVQLRRHGLVSAGDASEEELDQGMFELFRSHPQDLFNCGKQAQHLISLHRLSLDHRIENMLQQLGLEFPCISTRPVLFFNSRHLAKEKVHWKVFPHQDWRSMQGSLDSMIVWLPLSDIDVALGALEIVPGSHKLGLVETEVVESFFGKVEEFTDDDFVPVPVSQGDVLFMSAFLVHRSGNNVTETIRWSCHFRYNNLDERTFIDRGYPHAYVYKPVDGLITPGFPTREQLDDVFG